MGEAKDSEAWEKTRRIAHVIGVTVAGAYHTGLLHRGSDRSTVLELVDDVLADIDVHGIDGVTMNAREGRT